jgi:hypothetical protein
MNVFYVGIAIKWEKQKTHTHTIYSSKFLSKIQKKVINYTIEIWGELEKKNLELTCFCCCCWRGVGEELPEFRPRKRANADFKFSVFVAFLCSGPRSNRKQIFVLHNRILKDFFRFSFISPRVSSSRFH